MKADRSAVLAQLKKQLLEAQGLRPIATGSGMGFGLGEIEACFPSNTFPTGTIHEFLCETPESIAASEGFISGLLEKLMQNGSSCIYISRNRKLFPPAMERFGVDAQQVIFVDVYYQKQLLWTMEEALKTEGLACVIAEISDVDFAQSRRLQLATEKSRVTGIILRKYPKFSLSATACSVRWKIEPLPSKLDEQLPGVGNPKWEVTLLKVRNGQTGIFQLEWTEEGFAPVFDQSQKAFILPERGTA